MYRSRNSILSFKFFDSGYWNTRSAFFIVILFISSCRESPNNATQTAKIDKPTFIDVAPIIYKNCTPCHHAEGSGPFELSNYQQIKKNANKIKFVTQTRYMPPWPADVTYTHFVGERILSDSDIELIKTWVENGAKHGDSSKITSPKVFYGSSVARKPDAVISFKEAIKIKGNGTDHFFVVKLPINLPKDTFVKFFEFVPAQRKLAHHVNGHLINYVLGKKENVYNGLSYASDEFKDYNELYKKMNILNDDATFPVLTPNTVYYLPGFTPAVYPNGIGGFRINKTSAVLLKNIHYGPSAADVKDSSYVNVYFGTRPLRPVFETQMGTFGASEIEPELIILPNKIQTFHTKATLDANISILSINPHMHLLGKSFWAFAINKTGDTIPLIKIKKWDFRWQYYYTFLHPVKIVSGSTIHVYGTFDNTANNPNNPNKPPRLLTQGEGLKSMQTTEEMLQFIFTYLPYKKGDEELDLSKPD